MIDLDKLEVMRRARDIPAAWVTEALNDLVDEVRSLRAEVERLRDVIDTYGLAEKYPELEERDETDE